MKHLSALDATFLHIETPEMPMHIGGLNLFDLPAGYTGNFYNEVKQHVSNRLHLASVFTKKLALMPFDLANPVWIEDGDIDLDYHVRQITLPKPGTLRQLEAYVGRLHSSLLDRSRPLWEFYVFDGLETGQAAFYSKIHHSALDGQGAAVMAQALLDIGPIPRAVPAPAERLREPYQPEIKTLLKAALSNTAEQCVTLAKSLPDAVKVIGGFLLPKKAKPEAEASYSFGLGPRTPFNVSITNQRSFSTLTIPLDETKEIAQAFGASLNDVILAICSGALRDYLAGKGVLPTKSLVAALPVSLREEGNTELNNQVSMMQITLASNIADPVKRIRALTRASGAMKTTLKSMKSILPTDFPSLGVPWLMTGLVSLYGRSRLADKMPPLANLVISNVPGARVALYLAGARMATNFPVSIVVHGMALNVTVQSYNGMIDFGLIACRRAVPDLADLAQLMLQSHQQLLSLARGTEVELAATQAKPKTKSKIKPKAEAEVTAKPAKASAAVKKAATAAKKAPVATKKTPVAVKKAPVAVKEAPIAVKKAPAKKPTKAAIDIIAAPPATPEVIPAAVHAIPEQAKALPKKRFKIGGRFSPITN